MSKYTKEARQVAQTMKKPFKDFVVDIIEYPGHVAIRVYDNNVGKYSIDQKVQLIEYLYALRDSMRAVGCGCEIEGVEGDPPNNVV